MKITRKNKTIEAAILSIPAIVGFILLLMIKINVIANSPLVIQIVAVLWFIALFIGLVLPNVYWNDELILSKETLVIKGKDTLSWDIIKKIDIFFTEGFISNYIKVEVHAVNAPMLSFFLCKKSFWEWEGKSLRELKEKIPKNVEVNMIEKWNM